MWESVDLHVGTEARFEAVAVTVRLETMRTSLAVGGAGHTAQGRMVLTWDDGEAAAYEGPFGVIACARGFVFVLDGMDGLASVEVEGPDAPCPRRASPPLPTR